MNGIKRFNADVGEWDQPVMVKVNGKDYPTQLYNGVQRFIPNRVVEYMVNNEINEFNRNRGPSQSGNDLNTIVIKVLEGVIPLEDYIEFSTMHGYSVGGFCDSIDSLLDNFPGEPEDWFVIENPLWDEK